MQPEISPRTPLVDWDGFDTVLLDMDGTLLDKYFDDYFWEHYVPQVYAEKNGLAAKEAKIELMARYRNVESTLQWSDIEFWSAQLDLDIPRLKRSIDHLIKVHPYVADFLDFLEQAGKMVYLVTAAHRETLRIKMEKASLAHRFHRIICAEELAQPKESYRFWQQLEDLLGYDQNRTLLVDDNLKVLRAARSGGIAHLVRVAKPSSQMPISRCDEFASIVYFKELLS